MTAATGEPGGAGPEVERTVPVGARRSAEALAELSGLDVIGDDIEDLARAGLLTVVDVYKGYRLYDPVAVAGLADSPRLAQQIAARETAATLTIAVRVAAGNLGWRSAELVAVGIERGLWCREERMLRADVAVLEDDTELHQRLRRDRLLDADAVAGLLEIRRVDLDYLVSAGLLCPEHRKHNAGPVDRSDVSLGMFRQGDVEDVRADPEVPWETVWNVAPGKPSPLRELAPALPTRAALIRAMADRISGVVGVTVEAVWREPRRRGAEGWWVYRWTTTADGTPDAAAVTLAIRGDAGGRRYRRDIRLEPAAAPVDETV